MQDSAFVSRWALCTERRLLQSSHWVDWPVRDGADKLRSALIDDAAEFLFCSSVSAAAARFAACIMCTGRGLGLAVWRCEAKANES